MKTNVQGIRFLMTRDENDAPVVQPEPFNKQAESAQEFNSWRNEYYLLCDSEVDAKRVEAKVKEIGDFDRACVWLDKQ